MNKKLWLILPAIISLLVGVMIPFTYWPEMLNWPFFMSQGWSPYHDIAIVHTPILPYLLLLVYKLFGFTTQTLLGFGLAVNSLSTFIVTLLVYKQVKKYLYALTGGFLFVFLNLAFGGNQVWFENLLTPMLLGVFWFLLSRKFMIAGVLFALSILTKQTVAYLFPVIIVFLLYHSVKKNLLFFISFLVTIIVFLLILYNNSLLPDFYHWAVEFVFLKPTTAPSEHSYVLLPKIRQFLILFPLFSIPVAITFYHRSFKLFFASIFMLLSLLFAFPRFDYFHLLPAVSFLCVIFGLGLPKLSRRIRVLVLSVTIILTSLIFAKSLAFHHTFLENDVVSLANYLKVNYPKNSLFVLNGPDQIYFLTGKLPAVKPWIPQLAWYLEHYGDKFYRDFLISLPNVIILQPYLAKPVNGLGAYKPSKVLEYVQSHYQLTKTFSSGVQILQRR